MSNQVEEIKEKVDIVEYIGRHVELKKSGRNFKGICPFHQEKSPSFVVSPDRQIWHCFGTCGIGGDAISFLMKWENLTFYEALKELADQVGIKLEDTEYDDKLWARKEHLYKINQLALKYYSYLLQSTKFGESARSYLADRRTNDKIVKTFELGYAPASWDSLLVFLKSKGYTTQDVIDTGLAISGRGGKAYDRFRHRLMFPLKDAKGNVVGFSGRLLDKESKEAKYVNTPETEIYHKRENLFGIHLTKDEIRKAENVYVVEGEFDMITPFQHGVSNIVAIKGAAFTDEQLAVLKRYTKRLTLALDMDEAGVEAMKRGIRSAEKQDFEIYVAQFTHGKDPDESITLNDIQFKKDLKEAVPIYDFLISDVQKKYPEKNSFQKKKIGDELIPFIRDITNPIVQSHYLKVLAEILGVSEGSVYRLMRTSSTKTFTKKKVIEKPENQYTRIELIQRFVLSYLLQQTEIDPAIREACAILTPSDFTSPSFAHIIELYISFIASGNTSFNYTQFAQSLPAEIQSAADELFMFNSATDEEQKPDILKLAYEIKMNRVQKEMNMLTQKDDDASEAALSALSKEYNALRKQIK
ncbi:DNA primase [Candidatus Woesebacteria bacterium]|nr:DNA primase [Candidatus Woesebacteria bacterium]